MLAKALQELSINTIRYMRVMCALFPGEVRQAIKDRMAGRQPAVPPYTNHMSVYRLICSSKPIFN
jgi:hypothetical protein